MKNVTRALLIVLVSISGNVPGSVTVAQETQKTDLAHGAAKTANGLLQGRVVGGVEQFLGVPFAAPPIGDLRWKPPQPLTTQWSGVKDMTSYGPTCAQTITLGVFAAKSQSEDCLYLNIFRPEHSARGQALPVMVWIHGGGLFDGESNDYDGGKLARDGHVVVVTLNYRLNVFGFLALPGLKAEGQAFANYGLMDQQAALRWVKANIASFGGDPDAVTVFGESSGAQSVLLNLISPTASGLFQRAILESGSLLPDIVSIAAAEAKGAEFAQAEHCGGKAPTETVSCLRTLSVREIQAAPPQFMGLPVITLDGDVIARSISDALLLGEYNKVPVIDGTNQDEYRFILAIEEEAPGKRLTVENYADHVRDGEGLVRGAGTSSGKVLERYRLEDYSSPELAYAALATDASFNSACDALTLDAALARFVSVYPYLFTDASAPSYLPESTMPMGAYHTAELQSLFPLYRGATGISRDLNGDQTKLSDAMVRYWTSFARGGNPNVAGLPFWPNFTTGNTGAVLRLDSMRVEPESIAHLREVHNCDLWDSLPSKNPTAELR